MPSSTLPVTARLRPTMAHGPVGAALFLACVCAMAGGVLTVRTLQEDPSPQATTRVEPLDATSPESRLKDVAGYVQRWNAKVGPDGIAHIRYEELRSCYNLMTGEVLSPPGDSQPSGRRGEKFPNPHRVE